MDLLFDRTAKKVFTFDDKLGEQVWESEPITRFRFKNPPTNDWIQERLASNFPTAGIIFNGQPYIGTNDGFIYGPEGKVQRIPDIKVDFELFLDEFPFTNDDERTAFNLMLAKNWDPLFKQYKALLPRLDMINEIYTNVFSQEHQIDNYLLGQLGISGFVINKDRFQGNREILYDGSLIGIHETLTGRQVCSLTPQSMYQVTPEFGGFVPRGFPAGTIENFRVDIVDGIETRIPVHCVDYRSLWDVIGQAQWIADICPRDGSGYAAAKYATDGNIIAISHGDHPCYILDIQKITRNGRESIKSIDLDPSQLPQKLLLVGGYVFGDYGNKFHDFSNDRDIFIPAFGEITSIADSGLCTVLHENNTYIFNPFGKKNSLDTIPGNLEFLSRAPQK